MAAVVSQDIQSTYVPYKSAELKFTILGAASEHEAYTALDTCGLAPAIYQGIARREINITTEHFVAENTDKNIFRATVNYYVVMAQADSVVNFDTSGGQQHITQSYGTSAYPSGSPNLQNAINYDGDKVNGVDIVIPAMTFAEQVYKSLSVCNNTYRKTLASLTGKVNSATFRSYARGEVLFKGAAGQQVMIDGNQQWQITYTFAVSPNLSSFTVGNITVSEKLGWDYLWVLYADVVDGTSLVKRPAHVYVERIYDFANFSSLDI